MSFEWKVLNLFYLWRPQSVSKLCVEDQWIEAL